MELVYAPVFSASVHQVWPCCGLRKDLESVGGSYSEWPLIRELDKGDAVQACPRAWSFWFVPC